MGTNYTVRINACKYCGRYDELHVGKSSAGWKFLFQWLEGEAESVKDWILILRTGQIFDEYGRQILFDEFWNLVERKQSERAQFFEGMFLVGEYNFMKGDFS